MKRRDVSYPRFQQKRSGFQAFVHKHDALFTVLGALIVFVAYFMKEGVIETNKDVASTLKTVRTSYSTSSKLDSMSADVRDIREEQNEERIDMAHNAIFKNPYFKQAMNGNFSAHQMGDEAEWGNDDLVISEDVLKALPSQPPELLSTAEERHKLFALFKTQYFAFVSAIGPLTAPPAFSYHEHITKAEQAIEDEAFANEDEKLSAAYDTAHKLKEIVDKFSKDVNRRSGKATCPARKEAADIYVYKLWSVCFRLGPRSRRQGLQASCSRWKRWRIKVI